MVNNPHHWLVMKVHRDDEDPYYTIRVNSTGRERQTDANHLVRNSGHLNEDGTWEGAQTEQMGTTEYCESGSRQGGDRNHIVLPNRCFAYVRFCTRALNRCGAELVTLAITQCGWYSRN